MRSIARCTLLVLLTAPALHAQSFEGLGGLPDGDKPRGELLVSQAYGLSPDGAYVVGWSDGPEGEEAFLWEDGEMGGLGFLSAAFSSRAWDVSADGTTAVGGSPAGGFAAEAFRWTASGGMESLGFLPDGTFSFANGVSADGAVAVGYSRGPAGNEAFRWTVGEGMVGLGFLPDNNQSQAHGVSADGSVVAGWSRSNSGTEAFRWTADAGMDGIGSGRSQSFAYGVSADGAVVVGQANAVLGAGAPGGNASVSNPRSTFEAFRWTEEGGLEGLGLLPDGVDAAALDVSADGSVVVGYGVVDDEERGGSGRVAFIWTEADGMRALQDVLESDFGLDLSGWTLTEATAISDDGTTIVGYGLNSDSDVEGWRATLTPGTSTEEASPALQARLRAPHPNPFADRSRLPYDVAETGWVQLSVYDLLGRQVAVLVDGVRPAGSHEAVLDGAGLLSGSYVVRLVSGGAAAARRITLLR